MIWSVLVDFVMGANIEQHNHFSAGIWIVLQCEHNTTIVTTYARAKACQYATQLMRSQGCSKNILFHLAYNFINPFLQSPVTAHKLSICAFKFSR